MNKISILEFDKENMKFSSGHFTMYSKSQREKLHGHNFRVYVSLKILINANVNGMHCDYRIYKNKIYHICQLLDEAFLLPSKSKYLQLKCKGDYLFAIFNNEKIPFLKKDVIILPIENVTVEELSKWFIKMLVNNDEYLNNKMVREVTVRISSMPGQSGSSTWNNR